MSDLIGNTTHEVLYLRKWHDGEKAAGLPPYEVIAFREVLREGERIDIWKEVITHPADIRLIESDVAANGADILSGKE